MANKILDEVGLSHLWGKINDKFATATSVEALTASDVGADAEGSAAQALTDAKEYNDSAYANANAYTDQKIADLINGAPTTLDTLKEIADAMAENEEVVDALDEAIGTKANQAELDTHTGNSTIHITADERTAWNSKANGTHTHTSVNNVTPEWSGSIEYANTGWLAAWTDDGTKIKALNKNSFASASHTHDDRYYTESETNNLLAQKQANLGFTPVQQGTGAGQLGNTVKIGWSGSRLKASVDSTDMGNFVFDGHLAGASVNYANSAGSAGYVHWNNVDGKPTVMAANYMTPAADIDTVLTNGSYYVSPSTTGNSPGTYGQMLVMRNADTTGQLYIPYSSSDGVLRYRGASDGGGFYAWRNVLDNTNYNSYSPTLTGGGASGTWGINITGSAGSASTATTATTAARLARGGDTSVPMTFNWSGQSGQPSWLWGGEDGTNMYVYNPANFSVSYANSAGSATNATTASMANAVWTQSHQGSWYINSNWDGTYFQVNAKSTDGSELPVGVNYAAYSNASGTISNQGSAATKDIVMTTTDPGAGVASSYKEGSIICVYE